ncbi:MAG: hypothetical protein JRI70_06235 [Deltaproteobacteria bacterium]|nr:hypothetical protein [Deltaproteobacteria bacterium]
MSLPLAAEYAGILGRACELIEAVSVDATDQISNGAAQIRAYRLWLHNQRRHLADRRNT